METIFRATEEASCSAGSRDEETVSVDPKYWIAKRRMAGVQDRFSGAGCVSRREIAVAEANASRGAEVRGAGVRELR